MRLTLVLIVSDCKVRHAQSRFAELGPYYEDPESEMYQMPELEEMENLENENDIDIENENDSHEDSPRPTKKNPVSLFI